uniref:DDE Tnp4 domain-containing protein n=1 Tax=Monopterus albus TaxID=43700 RepID=A0A3Q3K840_MONAL
RSHGNTCVNVCLRYMKLKAIMTTCALRQSQRKAWKLERPHGQVFWSSVLNNFDDKQWKEHFSMSRSTFEYVLQLVKDTLKQKTTRWRKPIEPRRRLAVTLWWYATPSEYRTISGLFGVGLSTVCVLVRQVTAALKSTLLERFVRLPEGERLEQALQGFAGRGYPMCAGAIGGTHVPVIAPKKDHAAYFNRKGWHSIVMQAVVDHNFTDIYVGCPGSTHDARVLADSPLYKRAEDQMSTMVNGVEVPVHLIGDPAYPLTKWLMNGFTNHHCLTPEQHNFNYRLSSARMVVENAFDRLKGRWRCLLKCNVINVEFIPDIVAVCCILHNVCELKKDTFLPNWNINSYEGPQHSTTAHALCLILLNQLGSTETTAVIDVIMRPVQVQIKQSDVVQTNSRVEAFVSC